MSLTTKVNCMWLSLGMLYVILSSEKTAWLPIWGKVICSVLWLIVCMWIIGGAKDAE